MDTVESSTRVIRASNIKSVKPIVNLIDTMSTVAVGNIPDTNLCSTYNYCSKTVDQGTIIMQIYSK